MGRLIIDNNSKYLMETSNQLSKETIKLIDDMTDVLSKSNDDIVIATEIHENGKPNISTFVVSKIIGENIEILYCKNELDYR